MRFNAISGTITGRAIFKDPAIFLAGLTGTNTPGNVYFVDGTHGSDTFDGKGWTTAKATIQAGVDLASAGDTIYVAPKEMTGGESDPSSYAENVIIPATCASLSLIGINRGRTQGGLPQIKKGGSACTALLTVRAPGCLIMNLGFNGNSAAGAPINIGIKLDDNSGLAAASGGETKSAFGTTIANCHFKNCAGTNILDASTGGAILLAGAPWQVWIVGNRFYKNRADITTASTYSDLQDLIIEDNIFSGNAADVDCNIYSVAGGGGNLGVTIRNNVFNQLPALSSGVRKRYMILTGCTGMIVGNTFGCQTSGTGGTIKTFNVGGTAAEIPVTMHVADCWGQSLTACATGGEISIA